MMQFMTVCKNAWTWSVTTSSDILDITLDRAVNINVSNFHNNILILSIYEMTHETQIMSVIYGSSRDKLKSRFLFIHLFSHSQSEIWNKSKPSYSQKSPGLYLTP